LRSDKLHRQIFLTGLHTAVIVPHLFEKGYTITLEAFIIRKLVPKLWKCACLVMDSCPIHLGEEVGASRFCKYAKL